MSEQLRVNREKGMRPEDNVAPLPMLGTDDGGDIVRASILHFIGWRPFPMLDSDVRAHIRGPNRDRGKSVFSRPI